MKLSIRWKLLTSLMVVVAGCSPNTLRESTQGDTRTISGKLELGSYNLDNPVVIAHSLDRRKFIGTIARDGSFSLNVPAGATYQLLVANQTRSEKLSLVTRIQWPALKTNWAQIDRGSPIQMGIVQPLEAAACPSNPDEVAAPQSGAAPAGSTGSPTNPNVPPTGTTPPPTGTNTPPTGTNTPPTGTGTNVRPTGTGTGTGTPPESPTGGTETCGPIADSDLPYDARIGVGMEYKLSWSFLEKGPLPARIVSVTMEAGGSWRLAELQSDTKFVVTQADCEHVGNRDIGRDRIEVTWVNHDGSTSTDHLDMRYCDGNAGLSFLNTAPPAPGTGEVCTPTTSAAGSATELSRPSGICGNVGRSDLPYDARIGVGMEYKLSWSFLEKGPLPAKIISVGMEAGGNWRLAELQSDTKFVVTQADCDHVGNRDIGRDRIEVTWQNQDGSTSTDHLDMRYCDGNSGLKFNSDTIAASATSPVSCERPSTSICVNGTVGTSQTNGGRPAGVSSATGTAAAEAEIGAGCGELPPLLPPMTEAPPNAPCLVDADCSSARACFGSTCVMECVTQCGATTCSSAP